MNDNKDIRPFDFAYSRHYGEVSLTKAMSMSQMKKSIRGFDTRFSSVVVATLRDKEEEGRWNECSGARRFFFDEDADDFAGEMGMLADLHCIVKIGNGVVWVRRAMDTRELNIDDKVLNRMLKWFKPRKVKEE